MRAKEFVINVPITIHIDGDGDPVVNDLGSNHEAERPATVVKNKLPPRDPSELDPNPIMVPPLQQGIELEKADAGKTSPVVDELTQDETDPDKPQHFYNHDLLGEV